MKSFCLKTLLLIGIPVFLAISCNNDDEEHIADTGGIAAETQVRFVEDSLPYPRLSDYGFFEGKLSELQPVSGVLPYDLITPLFSDYALKKRFVWMKPGSKASYVADHKALNFEDGTVLIKHFYYENVQPGGGVKDMETRIMYRIGGEWHFAEYIWDEAGDEAHLHMDGAYLPVAWLDASGNEKGVDYRFPSELECFTCHKSGTNAIPLGPKPQNLDKDYPYTTGAQNQLLKWAAMGYLDGQIPTEINRLVAYDDPSEELGERLRSYLDVNCSSCHLEGSHCDYRPIRLAWNESESLENLGVCIEPQEFINSALSYIISPGNTARSAMHHRMQSVDEGERMPLLGRSLVHEEGLQLLTEYINSLETFCE